MGDSLVKGAVVKLAATALSIKPGGSARQIEIAGGLRGDGEGVTRSNCTARYAPSTSAKALTAAAQGILAI